MYILTNEPAGGNLREAFDALDDAFGTGEFTEGQAVTVIVNSEGADADSATRTFQSLVASGCVSEV